MAMTCGEVKRRATRQELIAKKLEVEKEIAKAKEALLLARMNGARGIYLPPDEFIALERECSRLGRLAQRIQLAQREARLAEAKVGNGERERERMDFARRFVEVARALLPADTFQLVKDATLEALKPKEPGQ